MRGGDPGVGDGRRHARRDPDRAGMIRGGFVFVALILLAAGTAPAANAFDETSFPTEVRESLKYAHEECGEGGKVTFAPDTVRKLDLTGDGRPDYIVDFRDTECAERAAVNCG